MTSSSESGAPVPTAPAAVPIPRYSVQLEEHDHPTPNIDGASTRLLRITVNDTVQSIPPTVDPCRLLDDLFNFVNRAFSLNYIPPYIPAGFQRFSNVDAMIKGLFQPDAVIWVLLRDVAEGSQFASSDFLATVTLSPYDYSVKAPDVVKDPNSSWALYVEPSENELPIIFKNLAVDTAVQGRGIGKWMLEMFEREAVKLARSAGRSRAHIALTTIMELNESFYKHHDWTTARRYEHPPGYFGNTVSITAVQMEKVVKAE